MGLERTATLGTANGKRACVAIKTCRKFIRERVFQTGFKIAFPCALLAGGIKALDIHAPFGEDAVRGIIASTAYSSFTFLIGLLVVFRTSQSYARYWDGCDAAYLMMSDFFDAASAVFAFCKSSSADQERIQEFQHVIIRMFSLLHAFILADLESIGDVGGTERALNYELIDIDGIDEDSLLDIKASTHKVDLAMQWIQSLLVDGMQAGILNVPPPILTRVFQEMNAGISQFHKALKIAESPFPFPYTAACEMCLIIHWVISPFVAGTWTEYIWSAAMLTFMQVFILWSLHAIATELENPFEQDMNDLDMFAMQRDLNNRLLMLMEHGATELPKLSSQACMDFASLRKRTVSRTKFGKDLVESSGTSQTLGTCSLRVSEHARASRAERLHELRQNQQDDGGGKKTPAAKSPAIVTILEDGPPDAAGEDVTLTIASAVEPTDSAGKEQQREKEVVESPLVAAMPPAALSSREGEPRSLNGSSANLASQQLIRDSPEDVRDVSLVPVETPEAHAQALAPPGGGRGCADCEGRSCPKWI